MAAEAEAAAYWELQAALRDDALPLVRRWLAHRDIDAHPTTRDRLKAYLAALLQERSSGAPLWTLAQLRERSATVARRMSQLDAAAPAAAVRAGEDELAAARRLLARGEMAAEPLATGEELEWNRTAEEEMGGRRATGEGLGSARATVEELERARALARAMAAQPSPSPAALPSPSPSPAPLPAVDQQAAAALEQACEEAPCVSGVLTQLRAIMAAAGDDVAPRPASVKVCFDYTSSILVRTCELARGRRLADAFPALAKEWKEWVAYVKRGQACVERGGVRGVASESSEEEEAEGLADEAEGGGAPPEPPVCARREERARMLDERTAAMSAREYAAFAKQREAARLRGGAHGKWCGRVLRARGLALAAGPHEAKLLGHLLTTRAAALVEAANRAAHGGRLAPPAAPLEPRHYEAAVLRAEREEPFEPEPSGAAGRLLS
ncbi:hypothetical protein AB1Y20_001890 [Prymnesium parvum]|uniref:Uncharacterized protein n=1 Tax=Prymnesium parvum TaxID=97485 RepID=A0AB34J9D9_PRYPA